MGGGREGGYHLLWYCLASCSWIGGPRSSCHRMREYHGLICSCVSAVAGLACICPDEECSICSLLCTAIG